MKISDFINGLLKQADGEDVKAPSMTRRSFLKSAGAVAVSPAVNSVPILTHSSSPLVVDTHILNLSRELATMVINYPFFGDSIIKTAKININAAESIKSVIEQEDYALAELHYERFGKGVFAMGDWAIKEIPERKDVVLNTYSEVQTLINDKSFDEEISKLRETLQAEYSIPSDFVPSRDSIRESVNTLFSFTPDQRARYLDMMYNQAKYGLENLKNKRLSELLHAHLTFKGEKSAGAHLPITRKAGAPKREGYNIFISRGGGETLKGWALRTGEVADGLKALFRDEVEIAGRSHKNGRIVVELEKGSKPDEFFASALPEPETLPR